MPSRVSVNLTKAYFDKAFDSIRQEMRSSWGKTNQTLVEHTNRFNEVDERFDQIDVKLEAIIETMATRQEINNLVHEIQGHGIPVDETKVFVT